MRKSISVRISKCYSSTSRSVAGAEASHAIPRRIPTLALMLPTRYLDVYPHLPACSPRDIWWQLLRCQGGGGWMGGKAGGDEGEIVSEWCGRGRGAGGESGGTGARMRTGNELGLDT